MEKFSLVLGSSFEKIKIRFGVANLLDIGDYQRSFNIVYGNETYVIINNQTRQPLKYKWGLEGIVNHPEIIHIVRAEGDRNKENDPNYKGANAIFLKSEYRHILTYQRCLILADAFIIGLGTDTPHLVYLRNKNRPFALAGIWNSYHQKEKESSLPSFALITTAANGLIRGLGAKRMPAILPIERESTWLRTSSSLTSVLDCLAPFPNQLMNAYPVSLKVNDPLNKRMSVIQAIGEPVFKIIKAPGVVHKKAKHTPSNITWADRINKSKGH